MGHPDDDIRSFSQLIPVSVTDLRPRIVPGATLGDWVIRLVHLGSFSFWLGGAAWHTFIVLPAVTTRPAGAAALKITGRGSRRHLPEITSLLLLTGSYQTIQLNGLRISGLLNSNIGLKALTLVVMSGLVLVGFIRNSRSG